MELQKNSGCSCGGSEKLVMACSGASDLGQISDLAARRLRDSGQVKMHCLAIIGAGIEKSIAEFKTKSLVVIDGCPVDCGRKMLENAGFTDYKAIRITDLGYVKGSTPVTDATIDAVCAKAMSCCS